MADAKKKDDPTVTSESTTAAEYPEGTHPAVPIEEGADAAVDKKYAENPDAAPSAVAQIEVLPDESTP